MHILIVGAGAIGAFYGSALARQGAAVSVVCRSDYAAVLRDGYVIRSPLLGDHVFTPHRVYRHTSECKAPPEVVMLTSKVLPQTDGAALIRPAVGPNTSIVLIQNGVDIEPPIAEAFPNNELISGIAYIAVGREGAGRVNHQSLGSLTLGRYPRGGSRTAERLAALFDASGVSCKVTDDIAGARWQKAVWNATFNPISIMGGVLDTAQMFAPPEGEALLRKAMEEVCAVAAASGHPIREGVIDGMINGTRSMPAYKTSMALDYENRRPMEIDAILGATVRAGRRTHIPTPVLDTIYALARMVELARLDMKAGGASPEA